MLAFPFYWMLQTSLKSDLDLYNVENVPFGFGDGSPTLDNYRFLFEDTQYARWLLNTVLVALAVVLITLVIAMPAGYALARLSGRWGRPSASASSSSTSSRRRSSSCRSRA